VKAFSPDEVTSLEIIQRPGERVESSNRRVEIAFNSRVFSSARILEEVTRACREEGLLFVYDEQLCYINGIPNCSLLFEDWTKLMKETY
jgi:hypothetical protein